jgi:hypothetical protein
VSSLLELFTNNEATEEGKVAIKSPAFSLTKVWGALTAAIAAVGGALPSLTGAGTTVTVAAVAAGTFAFVAFLGLAAVDLIVRQRAAEAKRRWPDGSGGSSANGTGKVGLVANLDDLILQSRHNGEEYELRFAELDGDTVTLIARKNGKALEPTFQPRG